MGILAESARAFLDLYPLTHVMTSDPSHPRDASS
jgi:hypothetical protein